MQVVNIENVSYRFNSTLVLENISFTVDKGDFVGIIGPNGAGKTTLFRSMLGLLEDYQGRITFFGEDIRKNRNILQKIGYIPQKNSTDQGFPATVEEIVSLGITSRRPSKNKINHAIETVGLFDQKTKRIGELSGGQQQRVLIAKALANEPELLILDEPVTGIDLKTQNKFYVLLKKLNEENKITIIWASHDLDAVKKLANKIACVNRRIFFHGDATIFFENNELLKAYSESTMQAHMQLHDHS
ncbi:MAG TPA: metal ABC transporter ATP-binding protein [Nitrososphaeraceae archaeon]|nr:metal ABC transporter ATP-binding protein [Nitrososphaeraceae archaeon]